MNQWQKNKHIKKNDKLLLKIKNSDLHFGVFFVQMGILNNMLIFCGAKKALIRFVLNYRTTIHFKKEEFKNVGFLKPSNL